MVPIADQNLPEHSLGTHGCHGREMVGWEPAVAPGWELGPDKHSGFISDIEVYRMRHFQVAAQQIDSEPLGLHHHVAYKFFGGRGVNSLWIEILVECRDHEERL